MVIIEEGDVLLKCVIKHRVHTFIGIDLGGPRWHV